MEPYLGLYVLAAGANDAISSEVLSADIESINLPFPVFLPSSVNGWRRQGVYLHTLHGQPVLQAIYVYPEGRNHCIYQQSSHHLVDFGDRQTRREFVRNQICTKLADRHFNLISWRSGGTLFTVTSATPNTEIDALASRWIRQIEETGERR